MLSMAPLLTSGAQHAWYASSVTSRSRASHPPPCLGSATYYSLTSLFPSRPSSWPLVTIYLSLTLEKTTVVMRVREANPGLGFRISSCPTLTPNILSVHRPHCSYRGASGRHPPSFCPLRPLFTGVLQPQG